MDQEERKGCAGNNWTFPQGVKILESMRNYDCHMMSYFERKDLWTKMKFAVDVDHTHY